MNGNVLTKDEIITVGRPLPRLAAADALDGRKLRLTWRSGKTDVVDLAPVLESRRLFVRLRSDDALFRALRVSDDGDAVEWPGEDLELSAVWLARLPSAEFSNLDFRMAMDELGVTLDGMAAALEISRRIVADYRKDKPIPRHIAFATRYLLERQARS